MRSDGWQVEGSLAGASGRLRWTPEDDAALTRAAANGRRALQAFAARTSRTYAAVEKHAQRIGVYGARKRRP